MKSVREDGRPVHKAAKESGTPYSTRQKRLNKVKHLLLKREENQYLQRRRNSSQRSVGENFSLNCNYRYDILPMSVQNAVESLIIFTEINE
jgi:hypothetical protein